MRREWVWGLAACVALGVGATCAEAYTQLAAPFYAAITSRIAASHPWKILGVTVARDEASHGAVLRLTAEVRRHRGDERPAALVVNTVQVGEVVETPIVFWTLLLLWPVRTRRRLMLRIALGLPFFVGLESATTACQLVHSLAEASALLNGERNPVTSWEHWSRFLEAGGRFVIEVVVALGTVAMASAVREGGITSTEVTPLVGG